ncbi:MAG: YbjN domain-containing protein [Thiogranum sp.]
MAANVLEVKEKVQRYLTEMLNNVQIDSEGDYNFRHGSSHIFIRVAQFNDDHTIVRVWAPTNMEVPPSPELYKYIATEGNKYVFGRLAVQEQENGLAVIFSETLLGEFLDPDELKMAITVVASTADDIDNEIQDKFGGRTFYQE